MTKFRPVELAAVPAQPRSPVPFLLIVLGGTGCVVAVHLASSLQLVGAAVVGVASVFVGWSGMRAMRRPNPEVSARVEPHGDDSAFTVRLEARAPVEVHDVTLTVKCIATAPDGAPRAIEDYSITLGSVGPMATGNTTEFTVPLSVARRDPPSGAAVRWSAEVRIGFPKRADWVREWELIVT